MSEAVFIEGEVQPHRYMQQYRTPAMFGTAGVSVSVKQGRIYHITAVNNAATAYFLQVFDKATAPIAGDLAIWECRLPASLDCDMNFGALGLYVALGFGLAISTTPRALTLAASNDAYAYAHFTPIK